MLEAAAKTFAESWRGNHEPETAALDAERVARSLAAQDVRTLVSLDGGRTLVPFQGRFEKCAGPLVGYIAVKTVGYWADMFVTVDDGTITPAARHAEAALDAIIANMRPGARADALHAKAVGALAPYKLHPVLGGSIGHGIGLSLHEGPEFQASGRCDTGGRRRLHIAGRCRRRQSRQCFNIRDRARRGEGGGNSGPLAVHCGRLR